MPPFLTAEWRSLVMLNYAVPAELLEPMVPAGTELDRWNLQTYISLVGFLFKDVRVMGMRIPRHTDFEEVNLRFYVRRSTPDGIRRGVVFVREIVPRRAISWVARVRYGEPYVALPMKHALGLEQLPDHRPEHVEYSWKTGGAWSRLYVEPEGALTELAVGSEEEFITEHYWGYSRVSSRATREYRVTHPRWRAWRARASVVEGELTSLYGPAFANVLRSAPASAFVSDGSAISVHRPQLLLT